ncbi:hypothetical protein AB0J13_11135 [Streptomyces anulatus]|uniref:hypothetical protein n=1 Tax=Streptomyces anulatus TaxID=1892 RepID=UPI0033E1E4DB
MAKGKPVEAETSERRAKLIRLRRQGVPYDDRRIMDLGYATSGAARKDVIRALERNRAEEAAEVGVYRQQENERLDAELERLEGLEAAARRVLANRHILVNNGRVILHPDTNEPMEDDAPVLQAIDRLVKIDDARRRNGERRAKLNGLDMPVKAEVSGPDGGPLQMGPVNEAELEVLMSLGRSTASANEGTTTEAAEDSSEG